MSSGAADPIGNPLAGAGFGFRGELAPTGRGDDIIIIVDPLKPEEALSQAQPQAANEWYDYTGICYHPKN